MDGTDPLGAGGLSARRGAVSPVFKDRREAGRALSVVLAGRNDLPDPVVLALPRGGIPVGGEVAKALGAPLDVLVVRKLGVPDQPELAMGAVASGGVRVVHTGVVADARVSRERFERVAEDEMREVGRRERLYRGDRTPVGIHDRTVLLVDDGLATGSTMLAAVRAVREHGARKVVVAVPVAPEETCSLMREEAEAVVCLETPEPFGAVGFWYESFPQLTDDDVREALARAWEGPAPEGGTEGH